MATYEELLAQYNAIPAWEGMGQARAQFLRQHPKFADRLERGGAAGGATGGGGGGNSGSDLPTWYGWGPPPPGYKGHVPPSGGQTPAPSAPGVGEPEETEEEDEEEDRPSRPPYAPAPGYEWTWNGTTWVQTRTAGSQTDLRATLRDILDQFGLATQANIELIERAVREDWSPTKFTQELRQSPDYLANPLFAANLERARAGNRFQTEGEIIAYASQSRRLAKSFGYQEPSDAYIAEGIRSGLSLAEQQHRYTTQDRVNQFGAGVALVYREILGRDPTDQDLFEIFDPEISTDEIDDALRQAEYRGRPFTLGLGIRTEAEARAAEMLGITPDEWFSRFQGVAQNAPRFERLRAVEDLITQGLPSNFGEHLSTAENGILIRALVFQDQAALAQLQDITAREVARFKSGGTPVGAQGQLVGLLSPTERASFG